MSERIESYEAALRLLDGRNQAFLMHSAGAHQARLAATQDRQAVVLEYRQSGGWNRALVLRPAQPIELSPVHCTDGNLGWVLNRVGPSRMRLSGQRAAYTLETTAGERIPLVPGLLVSHDGSVTVTEHVFRRLEAQGRGFGTLLGEKLADQRWDDEVDDISLLRVPATRDEAQRDGFYGQVADRIRSLRRRELHLDSWPAESWWKGDEEPLRRQGREAIEAARYQLSRVGGLYSYGDDAQVKAELTARVRESVDRAAAAARFWASIGQEAA